MGYPGMGKWSYRHIVMEKKEQINAPMILPFNGIHAHDVRLVGGKNASLGEMFNQLSGKGIHVPDGFALTVHAFWEFIYSNRLKEKLSNLFGGLDLVEYSNLHETGLAARELMSQAVLPENVIHEIRTAYQALCKGYGEEVSVAVRSSATAEDLPTASFAGQHESFLNISGEEELIRAIHRCYVSLYTDRAIKYRQDNGFKQMDVALSVGVQTMVRSDLACSGVAFTIEPESGFQQVMLISGAWGLGENVVQGTVNPDEYYVFKPTFMDGFNGVISKKTGSKQKRMVFATQSDHQPAITVINTDTPEELRERLVLDDSEINLLAQWMLIIERHYGQAMDIEWARDGITGQLYIVQARPETVHAGRNPYTLTEYTLVEKKSAITSGSAIGKKITSGMARLLSSPAEIEKVKKGDIIVTGTTNPDWDPVLKKASAIITNKGGRTSHASIVARELGVAAIVGTGDATEKIADGQLITVSCAEGKTGFVYDGKLEWKETRLDFRKIKMPATRPMMILGDPEKAFSLSFYPNQGIGLMRLEFIINSTIGIHPMALVRFDRLQDPAVKAEIEKRTRGYANKEQFFVDKLAQAVATIACAFYPHEVIVRMSDFKSNEYASLLGGKYFEPGEENPMIGFRGASRYYNERYREGFRLECLAMKRVREEMGLVNVKLMIPFCRTVEEGQLVVKEMAANGLKRGDNGLEIYVMCEVPSNVILAEEFAKVFDGFSIGSNDLTQLTLGIDRDNAIIAGIFNENNPAAMEMIRTVIRKAKASHTRIGLCGQAPSDFPEYAEFLVEEGIDSISFNPDALIRGIENMNKAENRRNNRKNNSKDKAVT